MGKFLFSLAFATALLAVASSEAFRVPSCRSALGRLQSRLLCRRCQMASPDPVRAAQRSLHHQLLRSGVLITDSSRAGMPLRNCRFAPARARAQAS